MTSPSQFLVEKPLQAIKFLLVVLVLVLGLLGFYRVGPGGQLETLLLVPIASFALALVVAGETVVAAFRVVRADDPPTARLAARPGYTVVRAVEAAVAVLAVGGIVGLLATLPDEPPPGPGVIGLLFVFAGVGLLVLVASLVRTTTEYVYYRRDRRGDPAVGSPA